MSKVVDRPLNKTELAELKSVVKGEFVIIGKELNRRREQLEEEAEQFVRDQYAERIEQAKVVAETFKADVEAFKLRAKEFEEAQAALGIVPADKYSNRKVAALTITMADSWLPVGMKDAIDKAKRDVRKQADEARLQLDRREHEYLKRVSASASSVRKRKTCLPRFLQWATSCPKRRP